MSVQTTIYPTFYEVIHMLGHKRPYWVIFLNHAGFEMREHKARYFASEVNAQAFAEKTGLPEFKPWHWYRRGE